VSQHRIIAVLTVLFMLCPSGSACVHPPLRVLCHCAWLEIINTNINTNIVITLHGKKNEKKNENTQISILIKIRPLGTELFQADGQTDRHDEANSRFSQFCKSA